MTYGLSRTDDCILAILDKYADMVFRLAFMYLRNHSDAEDATQEIFLKLFRTNLQFNNDDHIKAWLITVTSNYCKDILKSMWRKAVSLQQEIYLPIPDENKREVIKQVMNLPQKYRDEPAWTPEILESRSQLFERYTPTATFEEIEDMIEKYIK